MEYILFLGLTRVGSIFPSYEEARKEAKSKGIWNICQIEPIDGKLKIVSRESFIIK